MILVCGDAMTDRYWYGDVHRISPEAPVPVAKILRTEEREGGAANVLNNVRAMGARAVGLFSRTPEPIVKIRVIGRSQQMMRIDFDTPQEPVSEAEFSILCHDGHIVVFSDYGKGGLKYVQSLIEIAKQNEKIVLVDPKGYDYTRYRNADVVKPNLDEMREMVGGWASEDELLDKASHLVKEKGIGAILLTRGAAGMTLITKDSLRSYASVAKEVYDVSGAGDTAIAALAVAMLDGYPLERAVEIANKAAGIVVGRQGTAVATKEEVFGPE